LFALQGCQRVLDLVILRVFEADVIVDTGAFLYICPDPVSI
jgi:hypothetical protein